MVRNSFGRLAFTMIELIFAIVVIAIAVLSLPVMNQITARGIENSIVQEAIFAASAELMGASSYYWDDNSMNDISVSHLSRVINISGDCVDQLRPGHINQPHHRMCLDNNTTGPRDASGGAVNDLNDAAISQVMLENPNPEAEGYKNTYTSTIGVVRNGNAKTITSTITNSDGDIIVLLRAQSANIGEIDFYKRRF